jgi:hypothetical protein
MGEETAPEIPIPMPEPPPPSAPLVEFFPFGPVNHIVFSVLDFVIEGKFWPNSPDDQAEKTHLFHFFPFGAPAQLVLVVVDTIWGLLH